MRGISHPAAVRRELPIIGVLNKQAGFVVADERQHPEILYRVHEVSTYVKDEPAIWRPARGPDERIRGLRRQQHFRAACSVRILLVNTPTNLAPKFPEQNPAPIRRPDRIAVASLRIIC